MAATVGAVRDQYERWPYPRVPTLGSVRRLDTWQLALDFLNDRCGVGPAPAEPRIWIAGCGTMQPYVFRLANPRARILATDLSARSLRIAERRCAWHGAYGIDFARVDLTDPASLPDGPFDFIECYGVLMNLADPGAALRALAARLAPRGVLRIMVYPHYSRQRIFQIQQIARCCDLHLQDRSAPAKLRAIMAALPPSHPLRHAFDGYSDARSDEGLVDGFLHAGDRGFRGLELGALCRDAGLRPAFWYQRPWARPEVMAPKLGLEHTNAFFVMHYLDLWQELRGNFVVCLTQTDSEPAAPGPLRLHSHLDATAAHAATPTDWLARRSRRLFGARLPNRLGDVIRLDAGELRRLARAAAGDETSPDTIEGWRRDGLLLGGERPPSATVLPADFSAVGGAFEADLGAERLARAGANPLYAHLFEAWRHDGDTTRGWLASRSQQDAAWREHADPLESERCPLGLTPYGTAQKLADGGRAAIDDVLRAATRDVLPDSSGSTDPRGEAVAAHVLRRALGNDAERCLEQEKKRASLVRLLGSHDSIFSSG